MKRIVNILYVNSRNIIVEKLIIHIWESIRCVDVYLVLHCTAPCPSMPPKKRKVSQSSKPKNTMRSNPRTIEKLAQLFQEYKITIDSKFDEFYGNFDEFRPARKAKFRRYFNAAKKKMIQRERNGTLPKGMYVRETFVQFSNSFWEML